MSDGTIPQISAVAQWVEDRPGIKVRIGATVRPDPIVSIPAAWLDVYPWLFATEKGLLLILAVNATQVYHVTGVTLDETKLLHLIAEHVGTWPARPQDISDQPFHNHRCTWVGQHPPLPGEPPVADGGHTP